MNLLNYPTQFEQRSNKLFEFSFKNQNLNPKFQHNYSIQTLIRPPVKIDIVTDTWAPEINGFAHSLLQLCKGLQ